MLLNPYIFTDINVFEALFDTRLTSSGSSDAYSLVLPIPALDAENFLIDWGDGTVNNLNTHTYLEQGIKRVKIRGTITNWQYNNGGDRLKLKEILSWGVFNLNLNATFYGCSNLKLDNVIGVPILATANLGNLFRNCTSLVTISNLGRWDVSLVTSFIAMFQGCTLFNGSFIGWNTISATNFQNFLSGCTNFNQSLNYFIMTNVTSIQNMLFGATNFNQDISDWDIRNLTNGTSFMQNKTSANYNAIYLDAIYNKWSLLPLKNGVTINFGSIKYTSAGQAGRDILTTTYGWTITDGGI